ncbi:MAG: transposase [Tannerellaceae bacterium]
MIQTLRLIPLNQREQVKEIIMDFSNSISLIARRCFPKAIRTIDRFHMKKLACDTLQ